jgi:hypothetical protein
MMKNSHKTFFCQIWKDISKFPLDQNPFLDVIFRYSNHPNFIWQVELVISLSIQILKRTLKMMNNTGVNLAVMSTYYAHLQKIQDICFFMD